MLTTLLSPAERRLAEAVEVLEPELLSRKWYFDVDCSKYCAYFVAAINHEMSVSSICDPIKKIEALLGSRQ